MGLPAKKKMKNEEHLTFVDQIKARFQEHGQQEEYLQQQADHRAREYEVEQQKLKKAQR